MAKDLPDWIKEGKHTAKLLEWLNQEAEPVGIFSGWMLFKAAIGNCVLIYAENQDQCMEEFHEIKLCGIFRKSDCTLYETGVQLYRAAGIPEEFIFPDKDAIQTELEKKVTDFGRRLIEQCWDDLVEQSDLTGKDLLPAINRDQIRLKAKQYLQMGKCAKDVRYLPKFSFSVFGIPFTDELLLRYLEDEMSGVNDVTSMWLESALADISKNRIYYGCIREEIAELERSAGRESSFPASGKERLNA